MCKCNLLYFKCSKLLLVADYILHPLWYFRVVLLMLSLLSCCSWSWSEGSSFRGLWLHRKKSPELWMHTEHMIFQAECFLQSRNLIFCKIAILTRFLLNVMNICKNDLPATSCLWERIQFADIMSYPAPTQKNQKVLIGQ